MVLLFILDKVDNPLLSGLRYELVNKVLRLNREDLDLEVYRTKARLNYNTFKISVG